MNISTVERKFKGRIESVEGGKRISVSHTVSDRADFDMNLHMTGT